MSYDFVRLNCWSVDSFIKEVYHAANPIAEVQFGVTHQHQLMKSTQ